MSTIMPAELWVLRTTSQPGRLGVQIPVNAPAEPDRFCGDATGAKVSFGRILDHRLLQFRFSQQLLALSIPLLQLIFSLLAYSAGMLLFCCFQRW
jgi:hypothetical protein